MVLFFFVRGEGQFQIDYKKRRGPFPLLDTVKFHFWTQAENRCLKFLEEVFFKVL